MLKKEEPHRFSMYDLLGAFLGSLLIGLTFVFKGAIMRHALDMNPANMFLVILFTIIIITFEIYALSYKFVVHKKERPFLILLFYLNPLYYIGYFTQE